MLAQLKSITLFGLEGEIVDIEVDIHRGLPKFQIVGLGDTAIMEARERVRSAIKNAGFDFSRSKIVVNLAPADVKKHGPRFDLPIALGILHATGQIRLPDHWEEILFVGELSFTGELRPISGILPSVASAKSQGFRHMFVPKGNAEEAALIQGIDIFGIDTLEELIDHLTGKNMLSPQEPNIPNLSEARHETEHDFLHIRGQEHAKRAMEIAAAGGHNILMSGPPGSGKTMLAKALPTILPDLTIPEALEIAQIYSISGKINTKEPITLTRPFRTVHHTASGVAIVGGGNPPRPGEISLAHRGVLFLDEFPEFAQKTLEVLRQPLEDGVVTVSRASGSCLFPAQMTLIAAMNPCPCGYFSDPEKECTCSAFTSARYQSKISGPLLDRIDLHVEVPRIAFEKLKSIAPSESSADVRERVKKAREIQHQRFIEHDIHTNSEMSSPLIKQFCVVNEDSENLLKTAVQQMNLSGRAYYRILKLARTIADLEGENDIKMEYVAEAIQYRERKENETC